MIPTTSIGIPSSVILLPITLRSPPNRCCHNPYESTATLLWPGWFSSSLKVRPRIGRTPSTLNRLALTSAPSRRTGSPWPVRITRERAIAAASASVLLNFFTSVKFGPDIVARCPPKKWYRPTSRFGSAYGSGFSSTPCTTLKIALFAPIPRASVSTATIVNPGLLSSRRIVYLTS